MIDYRAWEESLSERPIQPNKMADALVPLQAETPEVSRTASQSTPTSALVEAVVPSLPPASQDADTTPTTLQVQSIPAPVKQDRNGRKRKPHWQIPKDSMVRRKAVAIVAMRANGYTPEEIAKELGVTVNTCRIYLYRATKSGWLVNKKGSLLSDPHDRLEFDLAHKAVKNLEEMLDSDKVLSRGEKSVKMEATLALANGMLFKKFDQAKDAAMPTNILQINIQGSTEKLDITDGGTPLYVDGELVGGDEE